MKTDVTVVLSGYRRPRYLNHQYQAVRSQTVQPVDIMYWQNTQPGVEYDLETISQCQGAISNTNFGVWSRFYYALNARTNWVCIFDDDTVPGNRWLENCLNTQQTHPGLLGTIGVLFPSSGLYQNVQRVGWDNPNEYTVQVDIVGHSWFFHRDMLATFCRELPLLELIKNNAKTGEDIHFSYVLQKYTDYKTYVPPHPTNDRSLWGSLKGWEMGGDQHATAGDGSNMQAMNLYLQYVRNRGFKTLNQ